MNTLTDHHTTALIIEDEPEIRRFLRATLTEQGFRYYEARTGHDVLAEATARNPDIILLDLGLPDMDGTDVIRKLREWTPIPIIILSARDQEATKVAALDLGADDYVTKPFSVNELLVRMRASLRQMARASVEQSEAVFATGALRIDLARRQVLMGGRELHLTPIEYKLLVTLVRYAGKVVTHRQLLKEVWGPLHVDEAHYLRGYMRQLRNKIEPNSANPQYLLTELGVGYRLKSEDV
jgi:two-component system KDP operon response regulator KdpE